MLCHLCAILFCATFLKSKPAYIKTPIPDFHFKNALFLWNFFEQLLI